MMRLFQRTLLALALAGAVNSASAFSLLGLYDTWQVAGIGYNIGVPGFVEIGGPMNLGEEYRWNVPTLYYAFDSAFLNYFGQKGVDEVTKAITILNNLPKVSQMSTNLAEFPNDTRRANYQAGALGLVDMKSYTLGLLINQLGVASPERWVWALRQRIPITGGGFEYQVIKRNFDPVTYNPSSYVNGTLYTYLILDPSLAAPLPQFADAIERPVDPLAFTYTAVASSFNSFWGSSLGIGDFFTGLTRDDVGALRYSYRANNYNIEGLATGVLSNAVSSDPWAPIGGTNTNTVVTTALRPGIEKITFVRAQYDSVFGTFITITNSYTDTYVTNSSQKTQTIQRGLTVPDILFSAADLAYLGTTFTTPGWVNNAALNSTAALAGPGIIQGQVVITYNKVGPYNVNSTPSSLDEATAAQSWLWAAFDGTTNAPFIFPNYITVQDLERQVLGGP